MANLTLHLVGSREMPLARPTALNWGAYLRLGDFRQLALKAVLVLIGTEAAGDGDKVVR